MPASNDLVNTDSRQSLLIDADSHVNEPPWLWRDRVPAKYRDRAPRQERFDEGDAWVLDGVDQPINFGLNATAGMPWADMKPWIRWEEIRPGGYEPQARLQEMDADSISAQVLYPTPRLSHSIIANQDPGFHLACVQAYNDWLSEYAGYAPDRLGGIALLPNRGVDTAVEEFHRAMALPGMKGALLGCYPHGDLEIDKDDDRLWHAIADAGIPLHIHVSLVNAMPGFVSGVPGDVRFYDAPKRLLQFIWSGVFERVPHLKLVFVEVDCGWLPYFREQVDDRYHRLHLSERLHVPRPPSEYLDENVAFTYITDTTALRLRHEIGVSNMMWSSDFPHIPADWPYSWRTIAASHAGIPAAEKRLMLSGNAQRLYQFRLGS